MDSAHDLQNYSKRETDVDHTHSYSHALKVMDWDYNRSLHFLPLPSSVSDHNRKTFGQSFLFDGSDCEGSGVWIDSEGIPSEETLIHHPSTNQTVPPTEEVESEETERIGLLDSPPVDAEDPILTDQLRERITPVITPQPTPPPSLSMTPLEKLNISSVTSVQELLDQYVFPSVLITQRATPIDQTTLIDLCRKCFSDKEGRELFLQSLDDHRGRNSELMLEQYERMKIAMKVCLISFR
jgi:hypothetical protein